MSQDDHRMSSETMADADALRFPIGRVKKQPQFSAAERSALLQRLAAQPAALRAQVEGLSEEQLDTPYRPGGWSVRQLAHHVADSHINAYLRIKLALTEHEPTVKPYDQDAWVQLADITAVAPAVSLSLFEGIHARLLAVLHAVPPDAFRRTLLHPDNGPMTIDDVVNLYAWHGDHHIAHVRGLRERNGWH